MVNARELRLRNIVKVPNDAGVYYVATLGAYLRTWENKGKKNQSFYDDQIIGIEGGARDGEKRPAKKLRYMPLTEEWLKDFGFIKHDDDEYYSPEEPLFGVKINHGLPSTKTKINMHIWDGAFTAAPMEFVHDLQNLFHTLTGKELSII